MKNDNGGIDMVMPSALKGGTYYEIARYIAKILESDLGLKLKVTNTSGSNPNIVAVSQKEALLSFCASAPLFDRAIS
ncbi:MAG TPA: hypothetical protein GXX20_01505 [Clostridiaceae bacterium]|nr:hypothetical protein [Clostridiaceae bacterium]